PWCVSVVKTAAAYSVNGAAGMCVPPASAPRDAVTPYGIAGATKAFRRSATASPSREGISLSVPRLRMPCASSVPTGTRTVSISAGTHSPISIQFRRARRRSFGFDWVFRGLMRCCSRVPRRFVLESVRHCTPAPVPIGFGHASDAVSLNWSSHLTRRPPIEELRRRREAVLQGGGEERVAKLHAEGRLTARERVELLLDPGSFQETGVFVEHRTTDFGMADRRIPGDGVVAGYGTVQGRLAFVFAQDFTVFG